MASPWPRDDLDAAIWGAGGRVGGSRGGDGGGRAVILPKVVMIAWRFSPRDGLDAAILLGAAQACERAGPHAGPPRGSTNPLAPPGACRAIWRMGRESNSPRRAQFPAGANGFRSTAFAIAQADSTRTTATGEHKPLCARRRMATACRAACRAVWRTGRESNSPRRAQFPAGANGFRSTAFAIAQADANTHERHGGAQIP